MHRLFEVGVITDDEGIFAAELHHDRDDPLRARLDHASTVVNRANEENRIDGRAGERSAGRSVSMHRLDQIRIVSSCFDDCAQRIDELRARPCNPLRGLEHDRVPGHQRGNHRIDDVLKRVIPRNDRRNDAEWVILESRLLVQQQARRDGLGAEVFLSILDHPAKLLAGRPDLPHQRVLSRLAGVALHRDTNLVLLVDRVREQPAQHVASLVERSRPPGFLGDPRACDGGIYILCGVDADLSQWLPRRRVDAGNLRSLLGRRRSDLRRNRN